MPQARQVRKKGKKKKNDSTDIFIFMQFLRFEIPAFKAVRLLEYRIQMRIENRYRFSYTLSHIHTYI